MPTPPQRNRSNRQGNAPRNGAETPAAKPPTPPTEREAKATFERIGDILKREREKRGDDLQQIADYLCIRRIFLEAIENNRYDELPADAYVIGFIRSYTAYLGLNGNEAIDRYRKEMVGRRRRPELSVPTPIAEGRTPSVAIMVSAVVAALVIYALWYGISSSDRTEVSAPPALPVATAPAAAPETTPATPSALATPPALPTDTGAPLALIPAVPATPTMGATADAPANTAAAPVKTDAATTTLDATANTAAPDSTGGNHVFGDTSVESRISIRAEKESWILIADDKGRTVFDRVLKPGDVYKVPDVDGLTLTAGNGNGIILSVDGDDLPKLANSSLVLRNISLDADELLEKTTKKPRE